MAKPRNSSVGEREAPARLRPRDAATLIIVDTSRGEPAVLMGQRGMHHVFMPGKYVFPGGRVDPADRTVESADEPTATETAKLMAAMRGGPSVVRARALPLAAIRETYEEAGLLLGEPGAPQRETKAPGWGTFIAAGFLPKPSALTFFARAITPPGRPRRFDTRFFCAEASAIAHRTTPPNDELSSLDWFALEQIRTLDLPAITRVVIEDLMDLLQIDSGSRAERSVPFYSHKNGAFKRELLTPRVDPSGVT